MADFFSVISDILDIVSPLVALFAIIVGSIRAIFAALAKKHVANKLSNLGKISPNDESQRKSMEHIRAVLGELQNRDLDENELKEARKALETAIEHQSLNVSDRDKKYVKLGLNQSSRVGEDRYTLELLSGIDSAQLSK